MASPTTISFSACGSISTSRGWSTGSSVRPTSRLGPDTEELRPPARLVDDAVALLERIAAEVAEPDRRDWLTAQAIALRTHAETLAGHGLPYLEHVERSLGGVPVRRDEAVFDEAAAVIDSLLPGPGPIAERLDGWDERFTIPRERLRRSWPGSSTHSGRGREPCSACRPARTFGFASSRSSRGPATTGTPGVASRGSTLNTDLPIRCAELIHVAAHETYPATISSTSRRKRTSSTASTGSSRASS